MGRPGCCPHHAPTGVQPLRRQEDLQLGPALLAAHPEVRAGPGLAAATGCHPPAVVLCSTCSASSSGNAAACVPVHGGRSRPSLCGWRPSPHSPTPPTRRTGSAQLRCNIIIALGDLALRFPNLLEPYTGEWRRGRGGHRALCCASSCQQLCTYFCRLHQPRGMNMSPLVGPAPHIRTTLGTVPCAASAALPLPPTAPPPTAPSTLQSSCTAPWTTATCRCARTPSWC